MSLLKISAVQVKIVIFCRLFILVSPKNRHIRHVVGVQHHASTGHARVYYKELPYNTPERVPYLHGVLVTVLKKAISIIRIQASPGYNYTRASVDCQRTFIHQDILDL